MQKRTAAQPDPCISVCNAHDGVNRCKKMQALQNLDAGIGKSLNFANDIVKTMQQQKIVLLTIFTAALAMVLEGVVWYLWVDMAVQSIRFLHACRWLSSLLTLGSQYPFGPVASDSELPNQRNPQQDSTGRESESRNAA